MKSYQSAGIGSDPPNVSLAIASRETDASGKYTGYVFFDTRSEPDWHPGLMYHEETMQISFHEDLITMVNPKSHYTFLNY